MKLVSVVVLAYRSADTIIETLESIKKQTYPQIELIVTDDCSPDNTVEVVESWMRDNKGCLSDMKLVTTKKNTGLPSNINRGLQAATGMYYKGIAGDDYLTEDAIEKYVDFCEENPGVFPIARVHLFTEHDNNPSFPEIQAYCNKRCQQRYKDKPDQLLECRCFYQLSLPASFLCKCLQKQVNPTGKAHRINVVIPFLYEGLTQ